MIQLREYAHGSPEYAAAIQLRLEVLRKPLGLTLDPQDLAREASEIHLGAFDGGSVVATLTLTPDGTTVKMRQVAVTPLRQGQGIGRKLVEFSETVSRIRGFTKMVLHARASAVSFYESLGYSAVGQPFDEVTIPHRAMEKTL